MSTAPWENVPTIAEELERKTTEFLSELQHGIATRKVNLSYVEGALRATWGLTAGLTDKLVMEAISGFLNPVEKTLAAKPPVDQLAVFVHPQGLVSVVVRRGLTVNVRIASHQMALEVKENETFPHKAAAENFQKAVDMAKAKGFNEVNI